MYRGSLRRELEDRLGVKRKKEDISRKDRGMKMAIGRYKDGALHIDANEVRKVANGGGGRGGRGRGGGGNKKKKRHH